jgi:hypothetical protein
VSLRVSRLSGRRGNLTLIRIKIASPLARNDNPTYYIYAFLSKLMNKMTKLAIKNRKNQKIVVEYEIPSQTKGLVFVMHGLSGNKDEKHIKALAESSFALGYTVVRFDTTNTFGESDGSYEQAALTNYYEDLEDVIEWSSKQNWYREPFILVGHSLGGISILLYAERYPEKVQALAPLSTVVSGKLSLESPKHRLIIDEWKRTGWRIEESVTVPGRIKKLPWSHIEDRLRYDVLDNVSKLTMPVLLIVGENDDSTPPEHQKMLFDQLPGKKEFHVIKDCPHTFVEDRHIHELKNIFEHWLTKTT